MNAPRTPDDPTTVWDLSSLYDSPDDPRRAADRAAILEGAESFASTYRGQLGSLDGAGIARMLAELSELRRVTRRYYQYPSLRVSVASNDEQRRADQSEAEGVVSKVNQTLAFQIGRAHV